VYSQIETDNIIELFNLLFYIEYGECKIKEDCLVWNTIGSLKWKINGGVGPSEHIMGDIVGWVGVGGYRETKIKINGIKKTLKCHRIVMTITTNKLIINEVVDHIDGNKLNNDPRNLRLVSQVENSMNKRKARSDSNSRLIGISKLRSGKWRARLQYNRYARERHLGVFNSAEDACSVYWTTKMNLEPNMCSTWRETFNKQMEMAKMKDSRI
jgi:hypothetical protein